MLNVSFGMHRIRFVDRTMICTDVSAGDGMPSASQPDCLVPSARARAVGSKGAECPGGGGGGALPPALLGGLEATCTSFASHMQPACCASQGKNFCGAAQRGRWEEAEQQLRAKAGTVAKRLQALLAELEAAARLPTWMRAAPSGTRKARAPQLRRATRASARPGRG